MKLKKMKMLAAACSAALMVSLFPTAAYAAFGLSGTKTQSQAQVPDGYAFLSGNVEIRMDQDAGPVIAALGTPVVPVFEQDSCAYQGKDKVYTYADFEISTYPKAGKECIASVYVRGTDAKTPEGVGVGSKTTDITRVYGNSDGKYGIYRYKKGNTELTFYTTGGVVDEFEYVIVNP